MQPLRMSRNLFTELCRSLVEILKLKFCQDFEAKGQDFEAEVWSSVEYVQALNVLEEINNNSFKYLCSLSGFISNDY